jgi:hypothetical protein
MTQALPPGDTEAPEPADDTACWQVARQLREQHPGWVIIWVARIGRYRARPLFRTRETVLTAEAPEELAAQMSRAEQAARPTRKVTALGPGYLMVEWPGLEVTPWDGER